MAPYTHETIKQDNKNRDFNLLYRGHRGEVSDIRSNITSFFLFYFFLIPKSCLFTKSYFMLIMNTDYFKTIKR